MRLGPSVSMCLLLSVTTATVTVTTALRRSPHLQQNLWLLRASSSRRLSSARTSSSFPIPSSVNNLMSSSTAAHTVGSPQLSRRTTPRVLSIQSHTVHGYVGNKVATLPLQCLGYNVDVINTVTLSNVPSYPGGAKGQPLDPRVVSDITTGLQANKLLRGIDIVLTGYCRSTDMIEQISSLVTAAKSDSPDMLVVCDPVLGDNGKYYVPEELKDAYLKKLIPQASVVTPNQFEAEMLTGKSINSLAAARDACLSFHDMGVQICVLKGLRMADSAINDEGDRKYCMVASIIDESEPDPQKKVSFFQVYLPLVTSRLFSGLILSTNCRAAA
jgi:pyridoxal kinase